MTHKGKKVRLYDLRGSKRVATVVGHDHLIHTLRFNDDVVVDGQQRQDRARLGRPTVLCPARRPWAATKTPIDALQLDSWRVLSGSRDHTVRLWDINAPAAPLATLSLPEPVFSLTADEPALHGRAGARRDRTSTSARPSPVSRSVHRLIYQANICWTTGTAHSY